MRTSPLPKMRRPWVYVLFSVTAAVVALLGLMSLTAAASGAAREAAQPLDQSLAKRLAPAAPIPPPEGYPKLSLSIKTVTPTLAWPGGAFLTYTIEIRNTGATTATGTILSDPLPLGVTYTGHAGASHGQDPFLISDTLVWTGAVGFDTTVLVTFSVEVDSVFTGTVQNMAVISDPLIAKPVTVSVDTVVTNKPILTIEKTSSPAKPGENKPLVYELRVTNWGQPAVDLPITVTDQVPYSTTLLSYGSGSTSPISDVVTWTRSISLDLGQSTFFTFSVDLSGVPSGTVIANENYAVSPFGLRPGELYTVTVVDPIFLLSKRVWPDPPGSNREMTYTLSLLNVGSYALDLVITDRVPVGVEYVRGGTQASGVVSWSLPSLDTNESEEFTYTVEISDVMNVPIVNSEFAVCLIGGDCTPGEILTSVVKGPTFETYAFLNPDIKKPGAGTAPVTPTLTVRNLGPGNALSATAILQYENITVSNAKVLTVTSSTGQPKPHPRPTGFPDCSGEFCGAYIWEGDVAYREVITFTTYVGQNTTGGDEGNHYTATIVITDSLTDKTTDPVSSTAIGLVTKYANVLPTKSGPKVVGPGHVMTYTINIWNAGMTTQDPPILTDRIPISTTFVHASDGGISLAITNTVIVSWTLPELGPGERTKRTFAVQVYEGLVSGTQIINQDYAAFGYGNVVTDAMMSGPPVTTTVQEVGLIHSFKTVTPRLSLPGPGNVLTYEIHLVNSSALSLTGVTAYDLLPWAASTYRRNAVASAGDLVSDIISIDWQGNIDAFSSEVITCSVLVDADFTGVLTNTVVISHPDLSAPVERHAVAYVTDKPLLFIEKHAVPDPVLLRERLTYYVRVVNLGQKATQLVITDTLPANVEFAEASAGGKLYNDTVRWESPVVEAQKGIEFSFQVTVTGGSEVVNEFYGVTAHGQQVSAYGTPVVTPIEGGGMVYLPLILKLAP